jgi:hypothetical protein
MSAPSASSKISVTETVPWLIFCAICLHLAFLWPYVILFPGSRVNAFSGVLSALPLVAALPIVFKRSIPATASELIVSLGLLIVSLISGWASSTAQDSSLRVMALVASGLGGFWSARILLNSAPRQRMFAWLCTACLAGIIVLSLWDYPDTGRVDYFLYTRSHPLIQMLLLLAVGPMSLVSRKRAASSMLGVAVLVGSYVTLYLIGVDDTRSAVLIPVALLGVLAVLAAFRSRLVPAALVLLLVTSAVVAHYAVYTAPRGLLLYQEYRLESYPFSWHIAKKHPVLGIGLRTPRDEFVKDYSISHPDYPDHEFAREVAFLVTSENVFLTLMVGLGLPFIVLYAFALIVLLWRLVRLVLRPPSEEVVFHPLVLFLPLVGSLLHSLTTDVLLYPQINWYFHILLGLIPFRFAASTEPALGWKNVCARATAAVVVVAVGIAIGTQQAFRPEGSPLTAPSLPSGDQPVPTPRNEAGTPTLEAGLKIHIVDYVGSPVTWHVMLLLDNSNTMAQETPPWRQSRLSAATEFASALARRVPQNAFLALRSFSGEIAGRKEGRTVPLRVSRLLCQWNRGPSKSMTIGSEIHEEAGKNNLCAAVLHSLGKDFSSKEGSLGRLVLLTDGNSQCSWPTVAEVAKDDRLVTGTNVDVIAVGMDPAHRDAYAVLVTGAGGMFLALDGPADLDSVLGRYLQSLHAMEPLPIEIRSFDARYRVMPGEQLRLPPGKYTIVLPSMAGLEPTRRKVADPVKIGPGENKVLTFSVQDGRPVLQ